MAKINKLRAPTESERIFIIELDKALRSSLPQVKSFRSIENSSLPATKKEKIRTGWKIEKTSCREKLSPTNNKREKLINSFVQAFKETKRNIESQEVEKKDLIKNS
ncbi:hypothetical protein [Chromobacterium phragmitis]|uniref:hypothetical protein n=1 Tax=Chromobacterium phragmitis TaxID=2202141 RepID=UPI0011AE3A54|nr:hypothetical protein [Chromobacterium phragmitis]